MAPLQRLACLPIAPASPRHSRARRTNARHRDIMHAGGERNDTKSQQVQLARAIDITAAASIGFNEKEDRRLKGKIRRLIRERGFGFIAAEDSKDVFFHRSALAGEDFDTLKEGNSVEFDLERGPKGLQAMNVRVDDPFRKQERGESMLAYCLKCRAKREIKDPKTITMKNGRPATQGTCPVCRTKMLRIGKA
jgi:cold shock CspA family protein